MFRPPRFKPSAPTVISPHTAASFSILSITSQHRTLISSSHQTRYHTYSFSLLSPSFFPPTIRSCTVAARLDKMANNADSSCNECIKGSIHEGLPQGKEEEIHGLNTYVVGNRTNPRGIIVVYSDVFGLELPNNKLIADGYAKSGEWLVYLPDFFKGDPVALSLADVMIPVDATKQSSIKKFTGLLASGPSFMMWSRRHTVASCEKTCTEFLAKLRRATPQGRKIGIVGFCWGGKYAIRAGVEDNMIEIDGKKVPLVDAVVALHPSHVAIPGDVETLVVPVAFGWGVKDTMVSYAQREQIEELHARLKKSGRNVPEMGHKAYNPGRHGFAVRGNPDDPQERACLVDSEAQVLEWFGKWLR